MKRVAFYGIILIAILAAGLSFIPSAQASTGKWRNINPTEYTTIPDDRLNAIYVLNGGTGGIGAGNAWTVGKNGTIFHWDGFSWQNQSSGTPCSLNSVNFGSPLTLPMSPFSSSAGVIVGGGATSSGCAGRISLFWDGFSWFPYPGTGLNDALNLTGVFVDSVSGSNPATVDAWAVGLNHTAGAFYHFNGIPASGGSWNEQNVGDSSSTGCEVDAIYMVSTTEGWAAGKCGNIYHYFGGNWNMAPRTPVSAFTGIDFKSIFMDSSTDGWAVGTNSKIAHYFGGTWTCCVTPSGVPSSNPTLRSISMVSSNEAWAVGDDVNDVPTIVHGTSLTGAASWSAFAPNQIPTLKGLFGVHATGGSNVWTVGETGSILLWDGSIWGSITSPFQTNFNSVFMTGSGDGIAVGNASLTGLGLEPTIAHWDGVKWARPQGTVASTDLWGTWEANSGEWWVVGGDYGIFPYTAHMIGGTLATVTPPTCPVTTPNCILLSVYGTSSSNVWTVGTGGIFAQWTGGPSWGTVGPVSPVPAGTVWRSITFVGGDSNKGWAVGYDAAPSPLIYCYLNACSMLGGTPQVWANSPVPGSVPASTRLNSVQTELDNNQRVWIAGSNGIILLINGDAMTITPTFTTSSYNLTSIFVDSSTDGWAVGQDTATNLPVFLHYDGTAWNTVDVIPPFHNFGRLQSLFLLSSTDGFAVGTTADPRVGAGVASLGMMFHLDPPGGVYATSTIVFTSSSTATNLFTSSSTLTSASSTQTSTSTTFTTQSTTSTSSSISTASLTSTSTVLSTAYSSNTLQLPGIPGFPFEAILAGLIFGLVGVGVIRRIRKK